MRVTNDRDLMGSTETRNLGLNTSTKDAFKSEVGVFEKQLKNRLENGEKTYKMGMTSMTERDWEDLMENIDEYMEKARQLREKEIAKDKKESMESRIYNKIYCRLHEKDSKLN